MYDELINKLYHCANEVFCNKCSHSPDCAGEKTIIREAADAIEDLEKSLAIALLEYQIANNKRIMTEEYAKQKQRWIPVTERLPEKDGKYITVHTLNTIPPKPWIEVCWFAKNLKKVDKYDFPKKKSGFYKSDSEYGFYEVSGITHWMPLPQPPKDGEP